MKAVTPYPSSADTQTSQVAAGISASPFYAYSIISFILGMLMISMPSMGQQCQFEAGDIQGPANACAYAGPKGEVATYSIVTTDASTFVWTLPAQATLVSGQGTSSVQVRFGKNFASGAITVAVGSACDTEDGLTRSLVVTKTLPTIPIMVVGKPTVCEVADGTTPVSYAVQSVPEALSYTWRAPAGVSIVSGQGTESVQVVVSPEFKSGYLTVRVVAACGTSGLLRYPILTVAPARPTNIQGIRTGICSPSNTVEFIVKSYPDASAYTWKTNVPGAVILNEGNKATITFPAFISGTVSVTANNSCGVSMVRSAIVRSRPEPKAITGNGTVCAESIQTFRADTTGGVTNFDWIVPEGSSIISGEGTHNISVKIGQTGGRVIVRAVNECDISSPTIFDLVVEQCEPEPPVCAPTIYPVPTAGPLHVDWCAQQSGDYHIYITDANTGCIVLCNNGRYAAGDNSVCLDVSHLKNGYYVFRMNTGQFEHEERIEIRH